MNEQLIAASRQALSCVEAWDRGCDRDAYWRDIDECVTALRTAIEAAEKQQALDKKAENARELGLDYEPASAYDQGWKDGYKHGAWANTLKETK